MQYYRMVQNSLTENYTSFKFVTLTLIALMFIGPCIIVIVEE